MRATGPDRLPCELLKTLPWATLRSVAKLFDGIFGLTRHFPQGWRRILIAFVPELPSLTSLTYARYLCLQNSLSRWCSACVVNLVEQFVSRAGLMGPLGIYGFQEG
eukprot:3407553-Pyramimonas_sp.AAC.1